MNNEHMHSRLPDDLPDNPMAWAASWLDYATHECAQRNPNAMVVTTVNDRHRPSARVVLCKAFVSDPGYVVFYTNYRSRKATEISENANVSLVLHWDGMGRQVRLEGEAVRSPAAESDAYFATRDKGSQLGAWASEQSQPIASREALTKQLRERQTQIENDPAHAGGIQRPSHWGGIRVWASAIELWIEGEDRIHDRARWTRSLEPTGNDAFSTSPWTGTRLQP